jgi:hypothetical protein
MTVGRSDVAEASMKRRFTRMHADGIGTAVRPHTFADEVLTVRPPIRVNLRNQRASAFHSSLGSRRCMIAAGCATSDTMDREDIIARLRENETALRARGVTHAALFGSRVEGDDRCR